MPPSLHWTGHFGGYSQQVGLRTEMVQANNADYDGYLVGQLVSLL